jgi:D-alanine-D-alanine ligase
MSVNVAVICGGPSAEADVSRKSALGVVAALKRTGHSVTKYELDDALASALVRDKPDVVFPITHGSVGEDGCLQGLLEVLRLRYVGCGVLASAIAANKPLAKHIWRTRGLPVTPEVLVSRRDNLALAAEQARGRLGASLVVKPANGGSAIGVHRLDASSSPDDIARALASVLEADEQALVEPMLAGVEVTCGVLEDVPGEPRALPVTLIRPQLAEFYDIASKYAPGGSQHLCPAPLRPSTLTRIQQLALLAHQSIGARDLSRTDFFVNEATGPAEVTMLELNTLPGMTPTSLYPEAAAAIGLDLPALCDCLVRVALARPVRTAPQVAHIPDAGHG